MPNQEHERERDQTHSYWYIPSAPRVNYSLLVMESAEMMKMATGEGFPPPAGCQNGSRLVFGGYGGFWRRNSRSIVLPIVLGYMEIYRRKKYVRGARGAHKGGGRSQGVGTPPYLVASLKLPLRGLQVFWASFLPQMGSVQFQVNWTTFGFPFLRNPKTR